MKIYRANSHPNFPHGGKYTPFLETQKVGDNLIIDGPYGRFDYQPGGNALICKNDIIQKDNITKSKESFLLLEAVESRLFSRP